MQLEEKIRIIPHRTDDAALSLAIDQILFEESKKKLEQGIAPQAILRTYQLSNPTIIFGAHQNTSKRYDLGHFRKEIHLTKRESGGGHIFYSPQDILFSFIAPDEFYNDLDLIDKYKLVNNLVAQALKNCGYNAEIGRTSIRIDGKIIAGTARQHSRVNNSISLHHGGILYTRYDDAVLKSLMARPDEAERLSQLVTSLQEYTGDYFNIPMEIIKAFRTLYAADIMPLTDTEISGAERLKIEKYGNNKYIHSGNKSEDICLIAREYTKDNDKKK